MSKLDLLYAKSIEIIKKYQSDFGLYIASPNFENYKFCWLRDGTFIAYSMDMSGNHKSSRLYYLGINKIIKKRKAKVKNLLKDYKKSGVIISNNMMPTRFTLRGKQTNTDWSEFQLDGYGIWLWGLSNHLEITNSKELLDSEFRESVDLVLEYLKCFWNKPNYDCWEENGNKIHSSTIGCIYSGLNSIGSLRGGKELWDFCQGMKKYLLNNCVKNGYITKFVGTDLVDSSLLWLFTSFKLLEGSDELMLNTIGKIEHDLLNSGLKRYISDEYYGGGEWPLLTSFLGWVYVTLGKLKDAEKMLNNVANCADENYLLPEQVPINLNFPEKYHYWKNKWGEIANPLLWSHAMYIILYCLLQKERNNEG